jgi:hypothetical protein
MRFQTGGTPGVISDLFQMLTAVQFHDQRRVGTYKIDDVAIDFVLTAKLPALQAAIAQVIPKALLGICLALPQTSRPFHVQAFHP